MIKTTTQSMVTVAATGAILLLTGCEGGGLGGGFGDGLGDAGYKKQIMCPVQDVKPGEAMGLARRVLVKHGFKLKEADVDRMSILTHPNEKVVRGNEGRLRDAVVKMPNRVRRTAELEFSTRGGDLQAWCKVKIERLSTTDHRVWSSLRQHEDAPTQTPIEREAATTPQQNTVWTSGGRDQSMELQILSDLRQRIQKLRRLKMERAATAGSEQEG